MQVSSKFLVLVTVHCNCNWCTGGRYLQAKGQNTERTGGKELSVLKCLKKNKNVCVREFGRDGWKNDMHI